MIVRRVRLAMATRFDFWLAGDDEEHLRAVGEAALDEVARIERLLSRFDPASEVSRLNREAALHPVRVDRELFGILRDALDWSGRTDGYFDPCATGEPRASRMREAIRLDESRQAVSFLDPATRLDLGAYGKGYALDVAARVLDEFGVGSALLDGGASSILARGRPEDAPTWRVELLGIGPGESASAVELLDAALSTSATFDPGSDLSDIVDPVASRRLDERASCSVVAPSATEAEVYSTALLAMGRDRAGEFLRRMDRPASALRVFWTGREGFEVLEG